MTDTNQGRPEHSSGEHQLSDRDGDKLDDRLVRPVAIEDDSVQNVVQRVRSLRLSNLPQQILEKLLIGLDRRIADDLLSVRVVEQNLHQALIDGEADQTRTYRRRIRQMGRDHQEIKNQRDRISDALEQRIILDGLAATLGGTQRARVLQGIVPPLVVFILVLLTIELTVENLSPQTRRTIEYVDIGCCLVFLLEFFLRLRVARNKGWFWRHNWIDFVSSIPIPTISFLRYGRALRLLRFVKALRLMLVFWRGLERFEDVMDVRLMKKSLKWGFVTLLLGTAVIYLTEGGQGTPVDSLGDSLWWSFVTLMSSGFGDVYSPVSLWGRALTLLMIIIGMILVGVFTATLTSVYVGERSESLVLRQDQLEEDLRRNAVNIENAYKEQKALISEIQDELRELNTRIATPPEERS